MKKYALAFMLFATPVHAEHFECGKHDGEVKCKVKSENVFVDSIRVNGGDCHSPIDAKIHGKILYKGDKFNVPGSNDCHYVSGVHIHLKDGTVEHHPAL